MEIHIFRGQGRVFGFTPDENGTNLPSAYGPWTQFKILNMKRGEEASPAVKTEDCLDDIEAHGFHLTDAHVRITHRVVAT